MDGCSQRFGRLPANHDRMDLATFLEQYRPGRYPLHEALVSGDLQRLQRQIIKAADLDERLPDGTTALHLAADLGMLEALECLLQHGADPELFDKDGRAPVHCAVYPYHGDGQLSWQCCQLLQASGAQLSRPCRNSVGATPLHLACRRHYHKTVEFLLDQGADIEALDKEGNSPVFWVHSDDLALYKILLDRGARLDAVNHAGQTIDQSVLEEQNNSMCACCRDGELAIEFFDQYR